MVSTGGPDDSQNDESSTVYANRHIPAFMACPWAIHNTVYGVSSSAGSPCPIQVIEDGRTLTAANILAQKISLHQPMLIIDTPDTIGMKVPLPKSLRKAVTVRDIGQTVGMQVPVHVIDVEYQEELEGWTFADLVEYFEDEDRVMMFRRDQELRDQKEILSRSGRRIAQRRQASVPFLNKTRHRVLNQISYEFSRTPLATQVTSPQFVRDLDWIDQAWPADRRESGTYPVVQYYCLTSAGGSYTDFHLDFGGSSVWYHLLFGSKEFILIPPTDENLAAYENWLCAKNQSEIFLPNLLADPSQVYKIKLLQNQTMIIPSAWIHAVYTPEDSLVFGGNFLHGLDMKRQLDVHKIEVKSKVLDRFRFPFFRQLQFYAGSMYLSKLRRGDATRAEVEGLPALLEALWGWRDFDSQETFGPSIKEASMEAAKKHGFLSVQDFLQELQKEYDRVLLQGLVPNPTKAVRSNTPAFSTTFTASPSATKLRLRISASPLTSSPRPPVQRLDQNTAAFPIKLSFASRISQPLPAPPLVRSKPREDMVSFVHGAADLKDEDWKPSKKGRVLAGGSPRPRPPASPRVKLGDSSSSPRPHKKPKATTTSRERLLKKVR